MTIELITKDLLVSNSQIIGPVLIVTPWYRPTIGGVAEVAERLHRLLTKKGVRTHLLVCDDGTSRKFMEAVPGCKNVWRVKIPCYIFYRISPKSLAAMIVRGTSALWHLSKFIRSQQIRTIILLYPIDYSWPFLLLSHFTGVRLIASYHGNDLIKYRSYSKLLRWLFSRTLLKADAIIVCARHLADEICKILPEKNLNVEIISNCVDTNFFAPAESHITNLNRPPTLVHVSNFNPKKRVKDIVKAFAISSLSAESRLVMVGNGPDYEGACELARRLGISDRVDFVGIQKDVRPFLREADVFVLASDDEGAPLVLLEAMSCGLPWVSTPWGAAAMLPEGECGLVVPIGYPEKLAAAIAELINKPVERRTMGRRGRLRAETDFSESKYVEEHCRVIRQVEGK